MFDIDKVSLPKWPQMRVWGRAVSPRQASDIIVRTDSFWSSQGHDGNNHQFEAELCRALDVPRIGDAAGDVAWRALHEAWERFQDSIGYISTEYVRNSWISAASIGGPHGWCQPDGRIFFEDNVGKWPSAEKVMADWAQLAEAFPFLDLEAALMTGESCEDGTSVAVVFAVANGAVTAHGADYPLFQRYGVEPAEIVSADRTADMMAAFNARLSGHASENHFTVAQVCEMVKAVRQQWHLEMPWL